MSPEDALLALAQDMLDEITEAKVALRLAGSGLPVPRDEHDPDLGQPGPGQPGPCCPLGCRHLMLVCPRNRHHLISGNQGRSWTPGAKLRAASWPDLYAQPEQPPSFAMLRPATPARRRRPPRLP